MSDYSNYKCPLCRGDIRILIDSYGDKKMLLDNLNKRRVTFGEYAPFFLSLTHGKKKQIRFRRWFVCQLHYGAYYLFKSTHDEYMFMGKYGKGMWDEEMFRKAFNKAELITIKK